MNSTGSWSVVDIAMIRYADDCNIYVRSERAGQRVMKSITRFITRKLKLKVNESKSAVAKPQERKFLGFSFTDGPEVKRAIAPKSLVRFKRRVREITRRAKGVSIETTMQELASYMRGWRSYFGFCETPCVLGSLTIQARINKRTYTSKKGNQVRMDQFGIGLHLGEDARQSASQLCLIGEVPIVGSVLPCVLPQPLRGV